MMANFTRVKAGCTFIGKTNGAAERLLKDVRHSSMVCSMQMSRTEIAS